ncbi:MAG: hypothetical protein U5L01_06220 [Rheinheimera sp.]|nr:hypothetical protein [Rheinheimera sp.]
MRLQDTDQRVAEDKPVTPAFIYAALLWYPVELRMQTLLVESGLNEIDALNIAMTEVLDDVQRTIAIPKRFSHEYPGYLGTARTIDQTCRSSRL